MDIGHYKEVAIEASQKAGEILLQHFGKPNNIHFKKDNSPVTIADTESEKLIISTITKDFPDHSILGEESGSTDNNSDFLWVIDPLDGTSNNSNKMPYFCISISLLHKKEPIVSVIYDPIHKDLFTACKGSGAYLNGEKLDLTQFEVPKTHYISLIYTRSKEEKGIVNKIFTNLNPPQYRIRNMGAAALELAYVSAGKLQGVLINGNNPWDVCGGILLISEAGGIITDFSGIKWNFSSKNIIAGHPLIHKELLEIF